MVIKADGSGSASLRVEVSKMLHEYLVSLAEVSGQTDAAKEGKVFDLKEVRKSFESRPGVTVKRIASPTPDSLEVDLDYRSVKDVFAGDASEKGPGALVFSESNGKKTLSMHLDKENYSRLSVLFPVLEDPVLSGMGPQAGESVSEEEYLQMIEFSLGSEGPALLKKSFIIFTVKPEGEIISQSGGTVSNGAVVFKIPLLRVLVLDKPLDYSLSFK